MPPGSTLVRGAVIVTVMSWQCSLSPSSVIDGGAASQLMLAGRAFSRSRSAAKPVNVTCWHQPAYVSPQRELHSSPHSSRPRRNTLLGAVPSTYGARSSCSLTAASRRKPPGTRHLRCAADGCRTGRGVAAAAGEGGRSLSITSTRTAGNRGTARPSSWASQAGIEEVEPRAGDQAVLSRVLAQGGRSIDAVWFRAGPAARRWRAGGPVWRPSRAGAALHRGVGSLSVAGPGPSSRTRRAVASSRRRRRLTG
jgi:hypothetical protein